MKPHPRELQRLGYRLFQVCWMSQIRSSIMQKLGAIVRLDEMFFRTSVAF